MFDFSEDISDAKDIWLIYGRKGTGKTFFSFSFPGNKMCLSFDRKSVRIKKNFYDNIDTIKVFDVKKYLRTDSNENILDTSLISTQFIQQLLEQFKDKDVDWIIFDGVETYLFILEMVMRKINGLKPFQGISNLNVWKQRRQFVDHFHNLALSIAKKGVIYVTWSEKEDIIKEGAIVSTKDVPKWFDAIRNETDIVAETKMEYDGVKKETSFFVHIISSKNPKYPTGALYNITNTTCFEPEKIIETKEEKLKVGDIEL